MEDAQARFQIMSLPAVTCAVVLLRTLPLSAMRDTAAEYDALLEWALASVTAGEGAGAAGLASPDEARPDLSLCRRRKCAQIRCVSPSASFRSGKGSETRDQHSSQELPAFLERLQERPLPKELIATLKDVAEIAMEGKLKAVTSTSWAAVAAGKEVEKKGTDDLLSEVGARECGQEHGSEKGYSGAEEDSSASKPDNTKGVTGETEMEMVPDKSGECAQRDKSRNRQDRLGPVPHIQSELVRML